MSGKPTQGPWIIDRKNPYETFVRGAPNEEGSRYVVAVVHPGHDNATDGNAALIAEAGTVYHETGLTPRKLADAITHEKAEAQGYADNCDQLTAQRAELLAALHELLTVSEAARGLRPEGFLTATNKARAAIAKATGQDGAA